MKKLACINCGAPINPHNLKCEYCGTQYRDECGDGRIRIHSYSPDVVVLRSQVAIDNYAIRRCPVEDVAKFTTKELTLSLAEALAPYIVMETERDPFSMTQIVRGTIRVLDPSFKF